MKSEIITSNSKVVGIAGGDASPASDPTVSVNQLLSNNTNNLNKDNKQLSLTGNRTSPQPQEKIPANYSVVATYSRLKSRNNDSKFNQYKAQVSRKELAKKKFAMRAYSSAFCNSQKIVCFKIKNSKVESIEEKPSYCKSWACPACAPYNARRVRRLIEQVVLLNNLEYSFTFTLDPKTIPAEFKEDTHRYITWLFNKLILYLNRYFKFKTPLKYVWVMEYQKNGNAHMHGLWNQFVDVNKLREIWVSIGGGKIMKLEKARDLLATARYVSKYLSKALDSENSNFYYFQKRYAISRNCVRKKPATITPEYSWENLVYYSDFLIKDYLATLVDPDDKDQSFSYNFFDLNGNAVKKNDVPKKET